MRVCVRARPGYSEHAPAKQPKQKLFCMFNGGPWAALSLFPKSRLALCGEAPDIKTLRTRTGGDYKTQRDLLLQKSSEASRKMHLISRDIYESYLCALKQDLRPRTRPRPHPHPPAALQPT